MRDGLLLPPPPPVRLRAPRMLCRRRRKVGGALGPLQTEEEMAFERATNVEECLRRPRGEERGASWCQDES